MQTKKKTIWANDDNVKYAMCSFSKAGTCKMTWNLLAAAVAKGGIGMALATL